MTDTVSSSPEETARLSLPGAVGVSQEQEPPAPPDGGPPGSSKSSREEPSAGIGTGSGTGTGSGRSSKLSWRDRLRLEAGAFPESGEERVGVVDGRMDGLIDLFWPYINA